MELLNIFTIIFLSLILKTKCLRQDVVLYPSSDCSGWSRTFSRSSGVTGIFHSFKLSGLWRIIAEKWSGENYTKINKLYEQHSNYSECYVANKEFFADYEITEVELIGPGTLPWCAPHLTLFTEKELSGKKFGIEWDEDIPCIDFTYPFLTIHSIAQFSNEAWLLYSEKNFEGDPFCLCGIYGYLKENGDECVDDDKKGRAIDNDDFHVYYDLQSVLTVASVKPDRIGECDCSESRTTVAMTTENPCVTTSEVSTTVNGPTENTESTSQEPIYSTVPDPSSQSTESSTLLPETSTRSSSDNVTCFNLCVFVVFLFVIFYLAFLCNLSFVNYMKKERSSLK